MTPTFNDEIHAADAALRRAKARLTDEIRSYPTPISGCDAQYVHLIAERNRVDAALTALERAQFVATPRKLFAGAEIEQR